MDRRQKKTRQAIFSAFAELLAEKNYSQLSVQEIIDRADVGRTTFYAHFETKDYLLKALCEELFGHIIDTAMGHPRERCRFASANGADSVFLHLLRHLQENDYNILALLSSENNAIFMRYFKEELKRLIVTRYSETGALDGSALPKEYLVSHIASSFVETVDWWLSRRRRESAERVAEYFHGVIEPLLSTPSRKNKG